MRRIDIKREGCRGFGFVLLLAVMIFGSALFVGCGTPDAVDSTLPPDPEPQIVDDDSTAPVLIPEPDDVPDMVIGGGVQLVVDVVAGRGMVSVECDDECAYSGNERYWFEPGRTVTVNAIPDEGDSFSRWSCIGVSCPIDTAVNPLQLSLYNEVDLTAIFSIVEDFVPRYGVEVGTPSSGGIAIASCEPNCLYDTRPFGFPIYILAEADEGYELEGWLCEGNCVDQKSGRRIGSNTPINPIELSRDDRKKRIEPVFRTTSADKANVNASPPVRADVYGEPIPAPAAVTDPADLLKIEAGEYGRVNYAVINDASYGDTDRYRRIVRDSLTAWQTLNPWLDFQEVSSEMDPELDLVIRFVNIVSTGDIISGRFCPEIEGSHICPVGSGSYDSIFVGASNALMDEEVSFCKTQGYLPGQPAYMHDLVMHEVGHFLGLGHNWIESHLMWNGDSPSRLGSFDSLGYSIPDPVSNFVNSYETLEALNLNIDVSPEESAELSARVSFLERILRKNYGVPEDARNAEVERERLAAEREALEQELVQLKIRLRCGELDPEYAG